MSGATTSRQDPLIRGQPSKTPRIRYHQRVADDFHDQEAEGELRKTAADFSIEEYRTLRLELLTRLDLQQKNVTVGFVGVGAAIGIISAVINKLGLSEFLSHESVVMIPFLSIVLDMVSLRQLTHREQMNRVADHLNSETTVSIQRMTGGLKPYGWNSPETGKMANSHWLWRLFGHDIYPTLVTSYICVFLSLMIAYNTHTFAGSWQIIYWIFMMAGLSGALVTSLYTLKPFLARPTDKAVPPPAIPPASQQSPEFNATPESTDETRAFKQSE